MKAFIYDTSSYEIVYTIEGESHQIESIAKDYGVLGVDEYGLSYSEEGLYQTADTVSLGVTP